MLLIVELAFKTISAVGRFVKPLFYTIGRPSPHIENEVINGWLHFLTLCCFFIEPWEIKSCTRHVLGGKNEKNLINDDFDYCWYFYCE
jgi:hypothetical protein